MTDDTSNQRLHQMIMVTMATVATLDNVCCAVLIRFVGQYLTRAEAELGELIDGGCVVSTARLQSLG